MNSIQHTRTEDGEGKRHRSTRGVGPVSGGDYRLPNAKQKVVEICTACLEFEGGKGGASPKQTL